MLTAAIAIAAAAGATLGLALSRQVVVLPQQFEETLNKYDETTTEQAVSATKRILAPACAAASAIVTALLLAGTDINPESYARTVPWVLVMFILIASSITDWRHYVIPDEYNAALALLGLVLLPTVGSPATHLIAGVMAVLVFGVLAFLGGDGVGMGDVKMALGLGFLFGWNTTWVLLFACAGAVIIHSAVNALTAAAAKRNGKEVPNPRAVPFGVYMTFGAFTVIAAIGIQAPETFTQLFLFGNLVVR